MDKIKSVFGPGTVNKKNKETAILRPFELMKEAQPNRCKAVIIFIIPLFAFLVYV